MVAVAADPPADARRVVENNGLSFSVLCDVERTVIRSYGLEHKGAGPNGTDVAIPALVLIGRDGRILWRHAAAKIQDRAAPETVLRALEVLRDQP